MDELMPAPDVERILSGMHELLLMDEQGHIDSEALMLEITRYLAAVDVFRTESCEPMWLPEWGQPGVRSMAPVLVRPASAH